MLTDLELKKMIEEAEQIQAVVANFTSELTEIKADIDVVLEKAEEGIKQGLEMAGTSIDIGNQWLKEKKRRAKSEQGIFYEEKDVKFAKHEAAIVGLGALAGLGVAAWNKIKKWSAEQAYKKALQDLLEKKKEIANSKMATVLRMQDFVSDSIPRLKDNLEAICACLLPASKAERRTLLHTSITKLSLTYYSLCKVGAMLELVLEKFKSYLRGEQDTDFIGKTDQQILSAFHDEVYSFSNVKLYIYENPAYYRKGISEGTLFFLAQPDVISSSFEWRAALRRLKKRYASIWLHTLFSRETRRAWKEYNANFLAQIPNINSVVRFRIAASMSLVAVALICGPMYWNSHYNREEGTKQVETAQLPPPSRPYAARTDLQPIHSPLQALQSAEEWIRKGNMAMDNGQYEDAINAYTEALKLDPSNANVMVDRGTCYRDVGEPDMAVKEYMKALELNPNDVNAHRNMGIVLAYDLKDKPQAIREFQRVLQLSPNDSDAERIKREIEKLKLSK